MFSNRTHPELKWETIKTENFNIHYHSDIYEIAIKGANIAEKVRPILMEQVGLEELINRYPETLSGPILILGIWAKAEVNTKIKNKESENLNFILARFS